MTRLPWSYIRSRTKSGDEREHTSGSQHWLSRRTLEEPSRRALSELIKEHKREQSGSSSSSHGSRASNTRSTKSRGNTVTSSDWDYDRTRPTTMAEPPYQSSRSPSPIRTREGSIISQIERPESAARSLISKGSQMLKKQSSKMTLNSFGSASVLGLHIPLRTSSAQGQTSPLTSSPLRGDDLRKAISSPFSFQHVAHTEQTEFPTLNHIDQSELAFKFSDVTARQLAEPELRGIRASALPRSWVNSSESISEDDVSSCLPRTPPRPSPPPKDSPKGFLPPVKLSPQGSFDHFFDSSSSSPVSAAGALPAELEDDEAVPSLDLKPLPQLPEVIHAVTTTDDSARLMKTAPLPTVPSSPSSHVGTTSHHHRKSSILRHMSTFPAPEQNWLHVQSNKPITKEKKSVQRHRSELALFQQAHLRDERPNRPISVGLKPIDIVDWEDAVDQAWDDSTSDSKNSGETVRSAEVSTTRSSHSLSFTNAQVNHNQQRLSEDESRLLGLGIEGTPAGSGNDTNPHLSFDSSKGALSKSSSQESIILSIASSILGTYHSSNSSVHSDYAHVARQEDSQEESFDLSPFIMQSSPLVPQDRRKSARPESGCLPVAMLPSTPTYEEEDSDDSTEDTVPPLPLPKRTVTKHRHAASTPKFQVPERRSSIIAGQPGATPRKRANTLGSRPRAQSQISYSLFPTPPQHQRIITKS